MIRLLLTLFLLCASPVWAEGMSSKSTTSSLGLGTSSAQYASLAAAVTALGSTPSTLLITTANFPVGSATTTPATLMVEFGSGASLDCGSVADTLHIYKMKNPGLRPVFHNCPSGTMWIAPGAVEETYPELWETAGDYKESHCTIASGSASVICRDPIFTSTAVDGGKNAAMVGAGSAGGVLLTTISSVTDATHATLGNTASTAVSTTDTKYSTGLVQFGTDDMAPLQSAFDAVGWGGVGFKTTVPLRLKRQYFVYGTQHTGGPGRQLFLSWDHMRIIIDGLLAGCSGRVSGGTTILAGGMLKSTTPSNRPTALNTQKWYARGNDPTYYAMNTVARYDRTITLTTPGNAANILPGFAFARTGELVASPAIDEPDAAILIVVGADPATGIVTLQSPAPKGFVPECFAAGQTTGKTTSDCTGGKTQSEFGLASVNDRTMVDLRIEGSGEIRTASDANFIYAEQIYGYYKKDITVRGRALETVNNVLHQSCSHMVAYHDTPSMVANAFCDGATGVGDTLLEWNYLVGNVVIHWHEGSFKMTGVHNTVHQYPDAVDVSQSLSFRARCYEHVWNYNEVLHDRPSDLLTIDDCDGGGIITGNTLIHANAARNAIRNFSQNWIIPPGGNKVQGFILYGYDNTLKSKPTEVPDIVQSVTADVSCANPTVKIVKAPPYWWMENIYITVIQGFDSDGTDTLSIGYAGGSQTTYTNAVDVTTTGAKAPTVSGVGQLQNIGAERDITAYYTAGGSACTVGRAKINFKYSRSSAIPSS